MSEKVSKLEAAIIGYAASCLQAVRAGKGNAENKLNLRLAIDEALAQARAEGWRAGQEAMRERSAQLLGLKPSAIRLAMGELTASEMRVLTAFMTWQQDRIRDLPLEPGAGHD